MFDKVEHKFEALRGAITNLNSEGGRRCSLCKLAWVLLQPKFRHDIFTFIEVAMDLTGAKKLKEIGVSPYQHSKFNWNRLTSPVIF